MPQASKQASIHMHVHNAVTPVWGSLRLAPIILTSVLSSFKIWECFYSTFIVELGRTLLLATGMFCYFACFVSFRCGFTTTQTLCAWPKYVLRNSIGECSYGTHDCFFQKHFLKVPIHLVPVDTVYAKSDLGWVDSNLVFLRMKKKSFLKFSVPVVLFVDGHKPHGTLEVIDLACEKKVQTIWLEGQAIQSGSLSAFHMIGSWSLLFHHWCKALTQGHLGIFLNITFGKIY